MDEYYLLVFNSTHEAIASEKYLKKKGCLISIISVPGEISRDCGLSIKIKADDIKNVLGQMKNSQYNGFECYYATKEGLKKTYTLVCDLKIS